MISFDKTNFGTNSNVLVFIPTRYWNICGTFVERLFLYLEPNLRMDSGAVVPPSPSVMKTPVARFKGQNMSKTKGQTF